MDSEFKRALDNGVTHTAISFDLLYPPKDSLAKCICTIWLNSDDLTFVYLLLVDDYKVWKKKISVEEIDEARSRIGGSRNEYLDCLEDLLFTRCGPKNDSISFYDGVFQWEKMYDNNIRMTFASFNFSLVEDSGCLAFIVSSFSRKESELLSSIADQFSNLEDQHRVVSELRGRLLSLSNEKAKMEEDLYSQFIAFIKDRNLLPR